MVRAWHRGDNGCVMTDPQTPLVDWPLLDSARSSLGGAFMRIYGYFREDAERAVDAVEAAMRSRNGLGMIDPAAALWTVSPR
jgi:histidine phosphotransfer protein HptB